MADLFLRKIRTRLDLLSISQSGGKNVKTFRWDQRLQIQNLFMASKWFLQVRTLGQHYNVGEKPTVIMYSYINRHAGTPEKQQKQKQCCSTSSNMVVVIYCYIGCKDKATTDAATT